MLVEGRGVDPERGEPSLIAEGKCELGADLAVPDIRGTGSQLGIALSQLHIRGKRVIQKERERQPKEKRRKEAHRAIRPICSPVSERDVSESTIECLLE